MYCKSKDKMMIRMFIFLLLLISYFSFANQELEIHGYIAQGLVQNKDSSFINDDDDVSADLSEIALNATYQISDTLRIAGQGVYLNGGNRYEEGTRLDYLLLDWNFYNDENWRNNLYFGRVKNYHRLYSMARGIPMIRPTIILPQAAYVDALRDIGVSVDGIGIKSLYSSEKLGEIDINFSFGVTDISEEQMQLAVSQFAMGDMTHESDLQLSAYWRPSNSLWQLGLTLLDAEYSYDKAAQDVFFDGDIILQRVTASVNYDAEFWQFSAEAFSGRVELTDFLFPDFNQDNRSQGGYVQGQFNVTSELNFVARIERSWGNKDDKNGSGFIERGLPNFLAFQHSQTLGLTYDFSDNWQFKAEHHWFQGTSSIPPVVIPSVEKNPNEHWQVSAVQLIYWF